MPNNNAFASSVNELLGKLEDSPTIETGIELANQIVSLFGEVNTKSVEDVFESSLELPNAERYDSWFQPHPIFKSDRACFDLADAPLLQAKFYWLKKRSRQILAGGVHFTPNYEDEEFTHNERYKVGLDFFLSPNGKSLQVVLSNRGNLRIVELSGRLNNTQKEIFEKWIGAGSLKSQEALHTTLWESFKLKSVNQKFYDGVSNSFTELLQHLKSIEKDEEEAKLFASRLLGRLLFCWFLRKKGIIDESIGYFNAHGSDATSYYKQSLERLFFLTLNTPIDERDELTKQHQKALFPELLVDDQPSLFKTDQKTPYLNGGLFEPHENDWYTDDSLTLPEGFFTSLYDHFEEFNFTTDESSPEYEQIAIDPEMLGRVFESLLATQVDETGQQARKAKGAFYTPREIVSYMCKESLRNYLYNAVNNDVSIKESIDSLLDISDSEWAKSKSNTLRDKVKDNRTQIIDALDAVTILDPACGSGAFPMGMLQLMLKTYERLESRFDPYKTKLSVIQNNIFGADIEPMAVEISRLRAWLSLIVDEDDPRSVDPLPNLDFKFVCANSLVVLDNEMGLFSDSSLHQKLKDIRTKYFNARKKHTKKALQDEYYKLTSSEQTTLITDDTRTQQLKSFDPFKNSKPADYFDEDQMFGISEGFNIIIGNPPYVFSRKAGFTEDFKKYVASNYVTGRSKINLFSLFIERGYKLLADEGNLIYIIQNTFLRAAPYKKLREYLVNNSSIDLVLDLDKGVFDNVTASTTVLGVSKHAQKVNSKIKVVKALDGVNSAKQSTIYLDQSTFDNSEYVFSLTPETNNELFEKLEINSVKLSSIRKDIVNGIVTSKGKNQFIANTPETNIHKPLIEGKDVTRFVPVFKNKYILFDRKILHRARADYVWSAPEKIIIRRISGGSTPLISAYDNQQYRTFASTNNIILNPECGYSIKYILGLLNSKLLNWYYVQKFTNGSSLTVNISKTYLDQLPIKNVNETDQKVIVNLIDEVLEKQKDDPSYEPVLELDAINKAVYRLYGLSVEEIKTIEEATK